MHFLILAFLACEPATGLDRESAAALGRELRELHATVDQLQGRIDQLEAELRRSRTSASPPAAPTAGAAAAERPAALAGAAVAGRPDPLAGEPAAAAGLWRGATFNWSLDTYYSYNPNHPIGRANLLRAYDVSSQSFSLNQIGVVLENAPDPAHGRPFGARVDLQWGQATQTLQGNPANEPRPEIYRALFQAYGTVVVPVGRGLTADLGKWASPLGIEGNYTKDQMNYSRSLWFDFLPFYHAGLRLNYNFGERLGASYWLVNGTQQTEDFNNFKDQLAGLTIKPFKTVTWTVNYYLGQEHPDVRFLPSGAPAGLPAQQGVPFAPIGQPSNGRLHIFDSYLTWQASPRLTAALEGDYVTQREIEGRRPGRVSGGAAYLRYQLTPRLAAAGRAEYVSDRDGLFSGAPQLLREGTVTGEYRFRDELLARLEWRRDLSSRPFFLTGRLGTLRREQSTLTLGMVWWYGAKAGTW